jgi:hypothetical protein
MTKEPKRGIPRRVQEIREDASFTLRYRGSRAKAATPRPLDLLVKHDKQEEPRIPQGVQEIRENAWFTLSYRGSPEKSETPRPLDLLVKHDKGTGTRDSTGS